MLLLFFEKSFILYVNMRVSGLALRHERGGSVQIVQDSPLGFVHVYKTQKSCRLSGSQMLLRLP